MGQPSKKIVTGALLVGFVALIAALWPRNEVQQAATAVTPVEIADAANTGLECAFFGNGREKLLVRLRNPTFKAWRVGVGRGTLLENATASVIVLFNAQSDVAPGEEKTLALQSAALSAANPLLEGDFSLADRRLPKIAPLLDYLASHREISRQAIQTAILVLTENLPLGAFAKFTQKGGQVAEALGTEAFKADVGDILQALSLLRAVGCRTEELAISIDPQLKIEAMIEPKTKPIAMAHYQIDPKEEWTYWKNELLQGEASTRHYAFYGIARFYPQTALKMLPQWASDPKVDSVYRLSAIRALGEISMPETVVLLEKLVSECGSQTELGKAAQQALESARKRLADRQPSAP